MKRGAIVRLQNALNKFVKDHPRLGHTSLRVDGQLGVSTKKLIRTIKYDLGYLRENLKVEVDENFFRRMEHPTRIEHNWGQTKEAVRRGRRRRARRRRAVFHNKFKAFLKPGVGTFDGKPVAKCAIPILKWCRANGWHGVLVSGWRDPKYSQSLCYRICGKPACPGLCAGLGSNHVGNSPDRFAIDVTDFVNFADVSANCPLQPHVHNSLPNDRVHFSPSGR